MKNFIPVVFRFQHAYYAEKHKEELLAAFPSRYTKEKTNTHFIQPVSDED